MEKYGLDFKHLEQKKRIDYEFQSICLECEEYFGKNNVIWTLPYKSKCTENIIRDSLKICKLKNKDFKYFLGIIRNKIK